MTNIVSVHSSNSNSIPERIPSLVHEPKRSLSSSVQIPVRIRQVAEFTMLVLDNLEAVGGVGSENSMPQRVVPRHAASDEDDAEGDDEVGEVREGWVETLRFFRKLDCAQYVIGFESFLGFCHRFLGFFFSAELH
ncbi:uncharacterized protein LOC109846383 [Asparagus officinalis]|uniref:uncharacterized protein LOC109846383 n=1 Tax=Asparagus officinalis TaxID=4686 RepID=UPI00098E6B75|nr:uncharacterized protein LOC109846383 [Asparagus officinalis]